MFAKRHILIGTAAAASVIAAHASTGAPLRHDATETAGAVAAAPASVEADRALIIRNLTIKYASKLAGAGVALTTFQTALMALPTDALIAALHADSIESVTAIVQANAPRASSVDATANDATEDNSLFVEKDGPGSGANSWIGYTAGSNVASGTGSAVAAGTFNAATNTNSSVFAGQSNSSTGISGLVIGGFDNHAQAIDSLVGAGAGNRATGARSVVIGGGYNLASGQWSFVGGGGRQTNNPAPAGGFGEDNVASGNFTAVPGGQANKATGDFSAVLGGLNNFASGVHSAALGGFFSTASGTDSIAVGCQANATNHGAIVISATTTTGAGNCADGSDHVFDSIANNEFAVRATGGTRIVSAVNASGDPTAGVSLASGSGSWANISDRAAKEDLAEIDVHSVLAKLMAMPVYTWRYRTEVSRALHMGPTAQDFRSAFGLGDSEKTITTIDEGGVALAAIKGLKQELDRKNARIDRLERELKAIKAKLGLN